MSLEDRFAAAEQRLRAAQSIAAAMNIAVVVAQQTPGVSNLSSDCDNRDGEVIFDFEGDEYTLRVKEGSEGYIAYLAD